MIILKHRTSDELLNLTYQEFEMLPNLKDYEPVDAIDLIEIYKSNGHGMFVSYLVTDTETGKRMIAEEPELYWEEFDTWDISDLRNRYELLTSDEEYPNLDDILSNPDDIVDY